MQPQSDTLSATRDELTADAKGVGASVANRLHSEVDNRKTTGATQVKAVSSALEQTASNLGEDTPNWLKSGLEQGAQQIQKFAQTLEQKDSRQLVNEIGNFARQSPGTFLVACAAVGFAAARVFKAGGNETGPTSQEAIQTDYAPTETVDAAGYQNTARPEVQV
ncbi:MAG: hypothetical protein ACRCY3_15360 [Sphingorhabdus sp.]